MLINTLITFLKMYPIKLERWFSYIALLFVIY